MKRSIIMVDETPYCIWDWELDELDKRFVSGIDAEYFSYMAEVHSADLDGPEAQRAALALRMTYSHAMETLMSLLCACVQSPDCVAGWLHKYRNEELDSVVRKITSRRPVRSKLKLEKVTWAELSTAVHAYATNADPVKKLRAVDGFAGLWARVAREFVEESSRREYNSIKHGLRARPGGFVLRYGLEEAPGVPCPPERMQVAGSSLFGSTYYVPESIAGVEKCNIKLVCSSRNWLPQSLACRTVLMSMSMRNVLAFLKNVKGNRPEEQSFVWPADPSMFDEAWKYSPGVTTSSFNAYLEKENVVPITKDEASRLYRKASEAT